MLGIEASEREASSNVALVEAAVALAKDLDPTDSFLRAAHSKLIEDARAQARAAYDARRAELEALGQVCFCSPIFS